MIIEMLGGDQAMMDEDGNWHHEDDWFEDHLNELTDIALEDHSPSQGDPLSSAFYRVARLVGARVLVPPEQKPAVGSVVY